MFFMHKSNTRLIHPFFLSSTAENGERILLLKVIIINKNIYCNFYVHCTLKNIGKVLIQRDSVSHLTFNYFIYCRSILDEQGITHAEFQRLNLQLVWSIKWHESWLQISRLLLLVLKRSSFSSKNHMFSNTEASISQSKDNIWIIN